jgi:streptogramin lyase
MPDFVRHVRILVGLVAMGSLNVALAAPVRLMPISELKPVATIHLGETADWVAIADDAVWVGSTGPNAVHRIDPRTNERVATIALPGEPCAGLATGLGSVWVPLCTKPTSLAKVDAKSGALTILKVGPAAEEGGVTTSADSVWLLSNAKGTLLRVDPASGNVRQTIAVPAGSYNPAFAAGKIWVTRADGAEVTSVDATSGNVLGSAQTRGRPRFLTAGNDAVWTLNQKDGSVTRIDASTGKVSATIETGMSGRGGDIAFADGLVWLTVRRVPLSAIDSATNTLLCQWVGPGGDSLRIGHGAIWLTDYDGGTVTRYDLKDATSRCRSGALEGTWKLTRYEDKAPDGTMRYPYGEHPVGQLTYDASGHMSIQIMKTPHPKVASGDDENVTPAEKIALYDAYTAYFGKYSVDATRNVVTTHAEADLADVFIGRPEERPFVLEDGRLVLRPVWTSDGTRWEGLRVFERAN